MTLQGKTIILGISGGIAAYKTVDLVSNLKKLGANVHVVATQNALKFVSPLSLETMSGNKVVFTENRSQYSSEIEHIKLADQADLVLIAPATANCIAKLAAGISDEILYDIVLASRSPIVIAPAMNTNMWQHATVKNNLDILINKLNYQIIDPEFGDLACGYVGEGRLADINRIVDKLSCILTSGLPRPAFAGRAMTDNLLIGSEVKHTKITITMGPTREYLDPVRYITNRSSGKMGLALAKAALRLGYSVDLISSIEPPLEIVKQVKYIPFQTHEELKQAIDESFKNADALIMAAAVVDYRPQQRVKHKLKKQKDMKIDLEITEDILAQIKKRDGQVLIGFSVETDNHKANALRKLETKNLDLIVVNSTDAFDVDSAKVDIIAAGPYHSVLEPIEHITLSSKDNIAVRVLESFNKIKALQRKGLEIRI